MQLVKQLLAKGNKVHATARSTNSGLSQLSDVHQAQLDVSDPSSIQASSLGKELWSLEPLTYEANLSNMMSANWKSAAEAVL